ncbi:MAG: hypothetical protein IKY43_05150 [Bacteroidales bacterium]|nr:hypothetical protein [Bacteroidales bacterium]
MGVSKYKPHSFHQYAATSVLSLKSPTKQFLEVDFTPKLHRGRKENYIQDRNRTSSERKIIPDRQKNILPSRGSKKSAQRNNREDYKSKKIIIPSPIEKKGVTLQN